MNKTQSTSRLSSGAKTLGHETTPVSKPSSGAPNQVTHMPFVIDPGTPGDVSKATKVLSKPISLPHGFGGDTSSPSSSFHFKGPSLSAPAPAQSESSELQPELALVPFRPVVSTKGSVFSNPVVLERILLRYSDILVTEVLSTEWTGASRNQCLLWAAMTSKAFRDPALDILWANLADGSLFYLLKTLSSFTLIQGKYTFQGKILDEDWARFDHYAKKVQSICVVGPREGHPITSNVYVQLARLHPEPLLPSLRKFTVTVSTDVVVANLDPAAFLCLSPATSSITFQSMDSVEAGSFATTLLSSFSQEWPASLTTLNLDGDIGTEVLAVLGEFTQLSTLDLNFNSAPPATFLNCLRDVEELKHLTMSLHPGDCLPHDFPRPSALKSFRNLASLKVKASSSDLRILFRCLVGMVPTLETLLFTYVVPESQAWTPDLELFSTFAPVALKNITLTTSHFPPPELNINTLMWFSPCKLRSLVISGFKLKASNKDILGLFKMCASTWADLKTLELPCFVTGPYGCPSLTLLEELAKFLPRLRDLSICVDTNLDPMPDVEARAAKATRGTHPLAQLAISSLVLESTAGISEAIVVSQYLERIFPNLSETRHYRAQPSEWWGGVFKLLESHRRFKDEMMGNTSSRGRLCIENAKSESRSEGQVVPRKEAVPIPISKDQFLFTFGAPSKSA